MRRSEKNAASICAEVILYVFFVLDHGIREIVHALVTAHPKSEWFAPYNPQYRRHAVGVTHPPIPHDSDAGALYRRRSPSPGDVFTPQGSLIVDQAFYVARRPRRT